MRDDPEPTPSPMAPDLTRRNMLIGAGLAAVAGLAYARQPVATIARLPKGGLEPIIPKSIGAWRFETKSGLVLPPSDALSDQLYNEILTRVYVAENAPPIMLLIASSNRQDGMLQVHRPEVCYPAGGFRLSNTRIIELPITSNLKIGARFFSAESVERSEQVMYWTRIGSELPTSWVDQRMAVVRANLQKTIPDGLLFRVSIIGPSQEAALPALTDFVRQLVSQLTPSGKAILLGARA
jgi:EpsI family protein